MEPGREMPVQERNASGAAKHLELLGEDQGIS
jgi:hypothetical protein